MNNEDVTKAICLDATTLGDTWYQAIHNIVRIGRKHFIDSGSFEGINRLGIPFVANILHPGVRPLYPLMPEGSGIPAPTSEKDINDYFEYLVTSEKKPNEHYTYGEDLHWQIPWAIAHYKRNGLGNNHCCMRVGRPESSYFYDRDVDYRESIIVKDRTSGNIIRERHISNEWNKDPKIKTSSQCLTKIDTWVDKGKLNFWPDFRSWDVWGGFPVNLGGIQLVKEMMADELGVEDGIMVVSCKDLHIYEHTWGVALSLVKKDKNVLKDR